MRAVNSSTVPPNSGGNVTLAVDSSHPTSVDPSAETRFGRPFDGVPSSFFVADGSRLIPAAGFHRKPLKLRQSCHARPYTEPSFVTPNVKVLSVPQEPTLATGFHPLTASHRN